LISTIPDVMGGEYFFLIPFLSFPFLWGSGFILLVPGFGFSFVVGSGCGIVSAIILFCPFFSSSVFDLLLCSSPLHMPSPIISHLSYTPPQSSPKK